MSTRDQVPYKDLYTKYDSINDLNWLIAKFETFLCGPIWKIEGFEEVYTKSSSLINGGLAADLYEGIRKSIEKLVEKMVHNLNDFLNSTDVDVCNLLMMIDRMWHEFSKKIEAVRNCLIYSERVYEYSVRGGSVTLIAWTNFSQKLLENGKLKEYFQLKPNFKQCSTPSMLHEKDISFRSGNFKPSPFLNADCLIDFLAFLPTPVVGLKFALISRQIKALSEYVLGLRSHTLKPITICYDEGAKAAFCYPTRFRETCHHVETAHKLRTSLPTVLPPDWISGVKTIQLSESLSADTLAFLDLLKDLLLNCHLTVTFDTIWQKLHSLKLFGSFLALFNDRCFSLEHSSGRHLPMLFPLLWPIWAIFNGIILPRCREIIFPFEFLLFDGSSVTVLHWLQHPSTETVPRRVVLRTDNSNWGLSAFEFPSLIERIKEDFMHATEKRIFFIELPMSGIQHRHWGEWFNPIGEQLVINQLLISRLPVEHSQKKFWDFYEHAGRSELASVQIFNYKK